MKYGKRRINAVGIFAVALVVFGASPSQAIDKFKMRVDWVPYIMHAPFYLAAEKGWYKERGLDVKIDDGTGSSVTVQMVATGSYDAGFAMQSAMAPGRDKGMMVKAIAGIVRKNDTGVIVPKGSGIKSVKDLVGKRILTSAGGGDAPFLDAFFRNGGISKDAVKLVYVAPSAKVSSYVSEVGDAVITLVPNGIPQMDPKRASTYLLFADYGLPSPSLGLMASDETIKKRPDALRAYVEVSLRAYTYMLNGHVDEAYDAMVRQRPGVKFNKDFMVRMLNEYRPFLETANTKGKPFGYQPPKDWKEAIRTMIEAGVIKPGADSADFFTNQFVPKS